MNILPQIRTPSALFALAVVAPAMFLVGGHANFAPASSEMVQMDRSIVLDNANVGVIDEMQAVRATLVSAREAMGSGDYPLAELLAEEAKIDAQVAERHAQSTLARKAAQDSQNDARTLRAEIAIKSQPRSMASN